MAMRSGPSSPSLSPGRQVYRGVPMFPTLRAAGPGAPPIPQPRHYKSTGDLAPGQRPGSGWGADTRPVAASGQPPPASAAGARYTPQPNSLRSPRPLGARGAPSPALRAPGKVLYPTRSPSASVDREPPRDLGAPMASPRLRTSSGREMHHPHAAAAAPPPRTQPAVPQAVPPGRGPASLSPGASQRRDPRAQDRATPSAQRPMKPSYQENRMRTSLPRGDGRSLSPRGAAVPQAASKGASSAPPPRQQAPSMPAGQPPNAKYEAQMVQLKSSLEQHINSVHKEIIRLQHERSKTGATERPVRNGTEPRRQEPRAEPLRPPSQHQALPVSGLERDGGASSARELRQSPQGLAAHREPREPPQPQLLSRQPEQERLLMAQFPPRTTPVAAAADRDARARALDYGGPASNARGPSDHGAVRNGWIRDPRDPRERRPAASPLSRDLRDPARLSVRRRSDAALRIQRWWRRRGRRRLRLRTKRERFGHFAAYRIQRVWRLWAWRRRFVYFAEHHVGWLGTIDWLKRHNFLYGTELAEQQDTQYWVAKKAEAPLDREVDPWGCGKMQEHMARMWNREHEVVERAPRLEWVHGDDARYDRWNGLGAQYAQYPSRLVPGSRVLSQSPPRTTRTLAVDKLRPGGLNPALQPSARSPRQQAPARAAPVGYSAYGAPPIARSASGHRPQSQPPARNSLPERVPHREVPSGPVRGASQSTLEPRTAARAVSSAAAQRYPAGAPGLRAPQRMLMVRGR